MGGGGQEEEVHLLEEGPGLGLEAAAEGLGPPVIGLVVAATEDEGAHENPPFDLEAKAGPGGHPHPCHLLPLGPDPVQGAVVAGQVGAGLRGGQDVVGGQGQGQGGPGDLPHPQAKPLEDAYGLLQSPFHPGAIPKEGFPHHPEAQGGKGLFQGLLEAGGKVQAGGVQGVGAGHGVHEEGEVPHGAGHGADLVQARGVGDEAEAAHPAVGGLEAVDPAEGGGLAHASPRVRAQGEGGEVGRHRRGASPAGAPGNPSRVKGVLGGEKGGVLRGGTHAELVQVGLAQDQGAKGPKPRHRRGLVGGQEVLQKAASRGGAEAPGHDVVLHGHHQARQGQAGVQPLGLLQKPFVQGEEGPKPRVQLPNPPLVGLGHLQGGDLPPGHPGADLVGQHAPTIAGSGGEASPESLSTPPRPPGAGRRRPPARGGTRCTAFWRRPSPPGCP